MTRVRHCVVRAIVRQPWLFDDPDTLARAITSLVGEVLAMRLATQLDRVGQTGRLGIVAMRLALPVPAVLVLAGEGATGSGGRRLPSFAAEVAVHVAASDAVREAVERVTLQPIEAGKGMPGPDAPRHPGTGAGPGSADPSDATAASAQPDAGAPFTPATRRLTAAVERALLAAARLGRLPDLLRRADPALLAEWAGLLAAAAAGPAPRTAPGAAGPAHPDRPGPTPPPRPAAHRRRLTGPPPGTGSSAEERPAPATSPAAAGYSEDARLEAAVVAVLAELPGTPPVSARLLTAATVAARLDLSPSDPRLWRALGGTAPAGGEPASAPAAPPLAAPATWAAPPAQPEPLARPRAARLELEVASVLPFLLVGPLDDLGLLDVVAAALAGPGWADLLTAFAAALARKTLPAPTDGWLHQPEVAATVAAFTGKERPPDGATAERLSQVAWRWWPVVNEALTATLADLRTPGSPLVMARSGAGLVVADIDGVAPMLWDADVAAAERLWETCGRPPVVGDPGGPWAPSMSDEASAGNDWEAVDQLHWLVTLLAERPAGGRSGLAPGLDAPVGLLSGVVLAALAWELWHDHERPHPALALWRLGDLGGRVSLEPDRLVVRMPLGRRHADLADRRLLRTVDEVPWLPGRRLELVGG